MSCTFSEGAVKITVVNECGKEAVVAILGPGDFMGEGCLAGQIHLYGDGHRDYADQRTCY